MNESSTKQSISHDPLTVRDGDTKQKLLKSALELFGRYGLEGVSTRQLAEAAGANLAAIPYYFGGKEGLYVAVARYILDRNAGPLQAFIDSLGHQLEAQPPQPEQAAEMLRDLILRMGKVMLLTPEAVLIVGYVVREQLHPTAAFDVLYEGLIGPMHQILTHLVAAIEGRDKPDEHCVLRAHAVIGQMLAFHVARATAFRRLKWDGYTPARSDLVLKEVAEFACCGLAASRANVTSQRGSQTRRPRRGR